MGSKNSYHLSAVSRQLFVVMGAVLLGSAAPPAAKSSAVKKPAIPPHKLIVICISGLDSRFLHDAERLRIKIPSLRKMMASGISADVIGVAAGATWPAHALMTTGVPVDDTSPGTPLWQAAEQKGMKTAAIYWPGTLDARIDFNCPPPPGAGEENASEFDMVSARCTPGLIDRVSKWDNGFVAPLWDDAIGIDVLRFLLAKENLDLIHLHLADLAAEQHDTGAMSIYARKVLENIDELLGTALQKLDGDTVVAITSDHGFDTASYVVRPKVMMKAAGLADAVFVKCGLIGTTSPKAAALLRKSIGLKRSGIAREVPMPEVRRLAPELRTWMAAFDTPLGFVANEETKGPAVGAGSHKGVGEMWPTHDSSRAVFILSGPGIRHARLPEIPMADEAPTFAEILGVKLPKAKGTSVLR